MNPLVECVQRIRDLGSTMPIEIPFLAGAHLLSKKYVSDLAALGARVHDVSAMVQKHRKQMPKFSAAYERFGTIHDFAILRHFVLDEILAGEPFMAMDNDIILNVTPEDIAAAYPGRTFLAEGSPCFGVFNDPEWLPTFCKYARLLHDDPASYAEAVSFEGNTNDLLVPQKVNGSDQSIVISLIKAGLLRQESPDSASTKEPFIIFNSWLNAGRVGKNLRYERIDGRDTINGRIVALSHLHKDFTNLLGVYLHVREINGFDGFGRIPIPGRALSDGEIKAFDRRASIKFARKAEFAATLITLYDLRRASAQGPLPFHQDPFSRRNIISRFYKSGDFGPVFSDAHWWQPGVWRSPIYDGAALAAVG